MQEDDKGMRDVVSSSSVEELSQDRKYEKNYENGIKDSIKQKRIKARFESIDVVEAIGKAKKNRDIEKKVDKEAMKDDAKVQEKGESRKSVTLNKLER